MIQFPNYMVTGYMRTGTTMMVESLEEAGLEPMVTPARDVRVHKRFKGDTYHPNKQGLYEMQNKQVLYAITHPEKINGKLIKCLMGGIPHMAAWKVGWKVIFMNRNYEEVRQSCRAFELVSPPSKEWWDFYRQLYKDQMDMRLDIDWVEINYRDVLEDPLPIFDNLVELGWPINPLRAVSVPDPVRCRYRVEDLVEGVL